MSKLNFGSESGTVLHFSFHYAYQLSLAAESRVLSQLNHLHAPWWITVQLFVTTKSKARTHTFGSKSWLMWKSWLEQIISSSALSYVKRFECNERELESKGTKVHKILEFFDVQTRDLKFKRHFTQLYATIANLHIAWQFIKTFWSIIILHIKELQILHAHHLKMAFGKNNYAQLNMNFQHLRYLYYCLISCLKLREIQKLKNFHSWPKSDFLNTNVYVGT